MNALVEESDSLSKATNVLCNKSSINSIYTSNHTLHYIRLGTFTGWEIDGVCDYLDLNEDENKAGVAREKIMLYHFQRGKSNIEELAEMDPALMPHAISWVARDDSGIQLMYNLLKHHHICMGSDRSGSVTNRKREL